MNDGKLVRCMTALVCEPWLITPAMHKTLCEIVQAHIHTPDAQHAAALNLGQNAPARKYQVAGNNVAVIPVDGVIGRKFSSALYSSGVTSVDVLTGLINDAAADSAINGILLVFDSPGGGVQGVSEASDAVKAASAKKRVIAYADGQMCSAAYWIASNSNAIYSWNESSVGSIGVYSAYLDESRKYDMAGVRVDVFKSGEHKGMGMPGTSLTDEQKAMIQTRVDQIGQQFRATVREGRGNIPDAIMQGQSFTAKEAKKNGLIDSIATIQDALRDAGIRKKVPTQG